MNNATRHKYLTLLFGLATCAACGSGLRLSDPQGAASSNSNAALAAGGASSSDANSTAADNGNTTLTTNSNAPVSVLKCRENQINGGYIATCTCSTADGHVCPTYGKVTDSNATADANTVHVDNPNAATSSPHTFSCTTQGIAGGYAYLCNCGATYSPGDSGPQCPTFYNPADPTAQAPTKQPTYSCESQAYDVGTTTHCTCVDGPDTAPCAFYQGDNYITSNTPYLEQCTSQLTATGVNTSCSCDAFQQASGVKCPSTFDPQNNIQTAN